MYKSVVDKNTAGAHRQIYRSNGNHYTFFRTFKMIQNDSKPEIDFCDNGQMSGRRLYQKNCTFKFIQDHSKSFRHDWTPSRLNFIVARTRARNRSLYQTKFLNTAINDKDQPEVIPIQSSPGAVDRCLSR